MGGYSVRDSTVPIFVAGCNLKSHPAEAYVGRWDSVLLVYISLLLLYLLGVLPFLLQRSLIHCPIFHIVLVPSLVSFPLDFPNASDCCLRFKYVGGKLSYLLAPPLLIRKKNPLHRCSSRFRILHKFNPILAQWTAEYIFESRMKILIIWFFYISRYSILSFITHFTTLKGHARGNEKCLAPRYDHRWLTYSQLFSLMFAYRIFYIINKRYLYKAYKSLSIFLSLATLPTFCSIRIFKFILKSHKRSPLQHHALLSPRQTYIHIHTNNGWMYRRRNLLQSCTRCKSIKADIFARFTCKHSKVYTADSKEKSLNNSAS